MDKVHTHAETVHAAEAHPTGPVEQRYICLLFPEIVYSFD